MRSPIITPAMKGRGLGWETWRGYVDVRDHGAIGDGITDNTVAFEIADAVVGSRGGTIFIPTGIFIVNNWSPRSSVRYLGSGMLKTRLVGTTGDVIKLTANIGNALFENMSLLTTASFACVNTDGFYITRTVFRNCNFEEPSKYGLQGYFITCKFDNCDFGIYPAVGKFTTNIFLTDTSNNNLFEFCRLERCTGPSISIGTSGQGYHNLFFRCTWDNLDNKVAYLKNAAATSFLNCWMETINGVSNPENCFIEYDTGNAEINSVEQCRFAGTQGFTDKILLFTGSPKVRFIGNAITVDYDSIAIVNLKAHNRFWHISNGYDATNVTVDSSGLYAYYKEPDVIIPTLANDARPSVVGNDTWLTGGTEKIIDFANGFAGQAITIISKFATPFVFRLIGNHDGGSNELTVMTDSSETFVVNSLIGLTIRNLTDGSSGVVTANDATTITVTELTGGTDNDWDSGDSWDINTHLQGSGSDDIVTDNGDIIKWICEDGEKWRLTAFVDASADNSGGA